MATNDILAQIQALIADANNILLISHASIDGDGAGSGLGLQMALTKMGKKVTFYSRNPVPEVFRFLPGVETISNEFSLHRDFIIQIDTTQTKVENVRTEKEDNHLRVVITPKDGSLSKEDISFISGGKSFDLIFTLDTSNLEYTGLMNGPQAELFYETPIINIDHHITNEQYGKINLVDINATSTAELVLGVIEHLEKTQPLMDEDIATCLLSGVVVDTGSFQNANTTPKAFAVAARLLAAGARQQEIVRHLFKMHELSTLKLWGRTLSKLEHDPELRIAWTTVSNIDFTETNASEHELDGLMDQLITSASDADIVFLIRETQEGDIKVSLRSLKNIDITPIVLPFGGGGHQRAAGFKISNSTLEKAKSLVVDSVKDFMKDYLERSKKSSSPVSFSPVGSTIKQSPTTEDIKPTEETHDTDLKTIATSEPEIEKNVEPTQVPEPVVNTIVTDQNTAFPPAGISTTQQQAMDSSYTEKSDAVPSEFLGYSEQKKAENSILEEKNVLTPQEKEVQSFVQPTNETPNVQ